jgi:hypothetical protein
VSRTRGREHGKRADWPRLACLATVLAIGLAVVIHAGVSSAATPAGFTSQHQRVNATIVHGKLVGLIITLSATCSNGTRLDFTPGFEAPFAHPQTASGKSRDSYNILGKNYATGAGFRQRAQFTAALSRGELTGNAQATQTQLASGVVCRSPKVSFKLRA